LYCHILFSLFSFMLHPFNFSILFFFDLFFSLISLCYFYLMLY